MYTNAQNDNSYSEQHYLLFLRLLQEPHTIKMNRRAHKCEQKQQNCKCRFYPAGSASLPTLRSAHEGVVLDYMLDMIFR